MAEQSSPNAPLTIQSVRELIVEQHNLLLDENDPILMLVTVHRAALDEYERLLQTHKQQLSEDMSGHVSAFAGEVRKSTNSILSKAVKANIENCLSVINLHQEQMAQFLSSIKAMAILSVVMFILSLITALSVIVWGA